MATHSSILAWRTPLTEMPGQPQSSGSQRVGHNWSNPVLHKCKTFFFFACSSPAPVKIDSEDGTAAWVVETPMPPSVQGQRLPQPQELWPYQSLFFFLSLWLQVFRWPLWLVFLHSSAHSGTYRAPFLGVLLCCSMHQAHRGTPPGCSPTLEIGASGT